MKRIVCMFLIAAFILLAACEDKPTLDGRNKGTFEASTAEIYESLPESKQKEYGAALLYLIYHYETIGTDSRKRLDGMGAKEIVNHANSMGYMDDFNERNNL